MEDEVKRLIDLSIHYRGTILHESIILEDTISYYLASYFVIGGDNVDLDKFQALREVVIDRMLFDHKIAIMEELLKRGFPDGVLPKKLEKLFSELRYIKDIRNRFAHYPVYDVYINKKAPKEFSLVNYRNGVDIKPFGKGEFGLFPKRVKECIRLIVELQA